MGDELAPDNIALGLETDRERERAGRTPFDAFVEVWNPTNYEYISLDEFDYPVGEPQFDAANASVIEWARETRVADPASRCRAREAAKLFSSRRRLAPPASVMHSLSEAVESESGKPRTQPRCGGASGRSVAAEMSAPAADTTLSSTSAKR